MTRSGMLAELYRRLGYASSPATEITTRLGALLDEGLSELISEPGLGAWIAANVPPLTFASVANQREYALLTDRIDAITERDNDRALEMRTLDWWRRVQPDPTDNTGVPSVWVPLGAAAVAVQPSNASQLLVDSTSASDTGTAFIEVTRTGGYTRTTSVTMTGTTAVNLGPADTIEVMKFYISAAAVGTVTLVEDTEGGTVLATIPIGETFSRYLRIGLWPTPSGAITYYADSERDLPAMANANDEPPWPRRFHRLLVDFALWKEWEKKDDSRSVQAAQRFRTGRSQLKYFALCPSDFLPARSARGAERSRFGAWYGPTRY